MQAAGDPLIGANHIQLAELELSRASSCELCKAEALGYLQRQPKSLWGLVRVASQKTVVIPERPQALSGTHPPRAAPGAVGLLARAWVPDKRFALSGMTTRERRVDWT